MAKVLNSLNDLGEKPPAAREIQKETETSGVAELFRSVFKGEIVR